MGGSESIGDLHGGIQEVVEPQGLGFDHMLERLALEELHDDKRLPLVLPKFVQGADVAMAERRGGARFAFEVLDGIATGRPSFRASAL